MKTHDAQGRPVLTLIRGGRPLGVQDPSQTHLASGQGRSGRASARDNGPQLMPTEDNRMSEKSKLPERIAGMAFGTNDRQSIQRVGELHRVSESHVVRSCVGIGLLVYSDIRLRSRIATAAKDHATSERAVIQAAVRRGLERARFGTRPSVERLDKGAEGEQRPKGKYPKRIAGLAFSVDDYEAVRRIRASREVSEAQVVRECSSIGLAIYVDDELRSRIEDAAFRHGRRERDIVYSAMQQGLEEALVWLRLAPVLRIRDGLRAEDPGLDLKLTEYIHAVGRRVQPVGLPDPLFADERDRGWTESSLELQGLHETLSESPLDEHDRLLASYLDGRSAEAKEQARRSFEARRSELLELRGLGDEEV